MPARGEISDDDMLGGSDVDMEVEDDDVSENGDADDEEDAGDGGEGGGARAARPKKKRQAREVKPLFGVKSSKAQCNPQSMPKHPERNEAERAQAYARRFVAALIAHSSPHSK